MPFIYKIASTAQEMDDIFRLNYRSFVEEIPQHPPQAERKLVDKFHDENTYLICKDGDRLAGMLAVRDRRPFSMDGKIPGFERYLPWRPQRMVEIRLLAVNPAYRGSRLLGSGTLANDAVAGQLKRLGGRGLILVNGEFGRRLTAHARRWQLAFDTIESEYGLPFDDRRAEAAAASGRYRWIWAVHGETSTGVLNDLARLNAIAAGHGLALAMDCVSSFGAVPFSLEGVALASGVSGKALGSYTGVSFVFHQDELTPDESIPPYVDAGAYAAADGVPYSQSSNLLNALAAALRAYDAHGPYETVRRRYLAVREGVERIGLHVLAHRSFAAPYIVTVVLPESVSSRELGDRMADQGFELQYESGYLLARNWIQIATLGLQKDKDIRRMLDTLEWFVHHSNEYAASGASAMNGLALPTT